MKKIYVCQAIGNKKVKPFVRKFVVYLIIILVKIYMLINLIIFTIYAVQMGQNNHINNDLMIMLVAFIGFMTQRYTRPPRIEIDSLHWFTYAGRIEYYSVQLKDIHYFSITNKKIILHDNRRKVVSIPFLDFEDVDLIGFAIAINRIIETDMDFKSVLSSVDGKIQGFTCRTLKGENIDEVYKHETFEANFLEKAAPISMLMMVVLMMILHSIFD
jgi:Ca2+/Na+ antiporter